MQACAHSPWQQHWPRLASSALALALACLLSGYPWIDAIMTQLREWGWCHHLARHSVACFLTRGDLYVSWERGKDVFEEHLIDQVTRCSFSLCTAALMLFLQAVHVCL